MTIEESYHENVVFTLLHVAISTYCDPVLNYTNGLGSPEARFVYSDCQRRCFLILLI